MGLVSNQLDGLYGGVNQQSAEQRLPTQVEEMINAFPTLDKGLLKRNPTKRLNLSNDITLDQSMYSYAYDRGSDNEKYVINILNGEMEIINIITGEVYKRDNGLTYENSSDLYLSPFGGSTGYASTTVKDTTFISNKLVSPEIKSDTPTNSGYLNEAYVWIKSSNPANPYVYTVTIKNSDGVDITVSTEEKDDDANPPVTGSTTTTKAASFLADAINNATTSLIATSVGSVISITSPVFPITDIQVSDSWGNQASFAWQHTVQYSTDLPKNLGFDGCVVKIIGSGSSNFATYWLKYDGDWKETKDPSVSLELDENTMPHILVRNEDGSFTFKKYDGWKNGLVGDIDSNPLPSFINSSENVNPTIKDIFFFKNRLGFITDRTVILSEVGKYGNFWRTTTAAVLDSDYIDAAVDTTKVISLEYATYLNDSMLLFSDKAQFKLEGGRVLSPKDIQISQTSAYEINRKVKPLFMNDKVFFCAIRGSYTAVMQYEISANTSIAQAADITAHVQGYIPNTISKLSGSPINNMLFLTSDVNDDTIWVYKYYDNGTTRVQSAWFKWTYNGSIYNAFSLGKNLNILINRKNINNSDTQDNFETSPIFPQKHTETFLDDATSIDNKTIIPTTIRIGKWVLSNGGKKDIRGHLKFKTVQISSEEDSLFELKIEDVKRNTERSVKSKYTVNRKPVIYGDAKNIVLSILNSDIIGFRINTISYEGNLTKRDSRR